MRVFVHVCVSCLIISSNDGLIQGHPVCQGGNIYSIPATFQRCMNETLSEHSEYSSTYIDDVLVYSSSWEEHLVHLRRVLAALNKAGLTAKPSKCVWCATSLEYLVHKIDNGVVSATEVRVKALRDYIRSTN